MIDQHGRDITYLRLSVTDRCNLCCRYCRPETGICKRSKEEMLSEDEMIRAVEAAASLGITKLRITGGEPLVKRNILSICRRASAVSGINDIGITTNGTLLPQFAQELKAAGIRRVNISLDTLDPSKYSWITRGGKLENAAAGIEAALLAGFERVKINAVLIGGFNENEIPALAELSRRFPLDVRFIEWMPMYDSGDFDQASYIGIDHVQQALPELKPLEETDGVARLYRLPEARGCIGLISPVSAHFCGSCSRLRLMADGSLKPCLHLPETSRIKGMTVDEMKKAMKQVIEGKPLWHGELTYENRSRAGHTMNEIGG